MHVSLNLLIYRCNFGTNVFTVKKNTKKTTTKKKSTIHHFCWFLSLKRFWKSFPVDFFPGLFFGSRDFSDVFCYGKKLPGTILSKGCSPIVAMCQNLPVFSVFLVNPNWSHHQIRSVQEMDPWKKSLGVIISVCLFCNDLWRLYICPTFLWLFDLILHRKRSRWIYSPDSHVKKSAQRQFAEVWKEVGGIYENSKPKYDPMIPVRSVQ